MSDIQRYDTFVALKECDEYHTEIVIIENSDGNYVKYDDHIAEITNLEKELKCTRLMLKNLGIPSEEIALMMSKCDD